MAGSATAGSTSSLPANPYATYGDYLSYGHGGYIATRPPSLPFFGGTGVPSGGMYGSNQSFADKSNQGEFYTNPLTGANPIGNKPKTATGP